MKPCLPLLLALGFCGTLPFSSCSSVEPGPERLSYGEHEVKLVQKDEGGNVAAEWEGLLVVEPFEDLPEIEFLHYWIGKDDPERIAVPVYRDAIRNRGPLLPCDGAPLATDFDKASLFFDVGGSLEQVPIFANPYSNDSYAISWALEGNSEEQPAEEDVFWFSCCGLLNFPGPNGLGSYHILFRREDGSWTKAIPYESAFLQE